MPSPSYAHEGQLMPKSGFVVVTDELRNVLDNLPADEPRSRLDPFRTFILRWRREGRSYRSIQRILAVECQVKVTYETLRRFVQRRTKPRKKAEVEIEQPVTAQLSLSQTVVRPPGDASRDPYAEARERMRQHKAEPVQPKKPKIFEMNEEDFEKPLRMMPKP